MEVLASAPIPSLSPLDGAYGPGTTAREQFRLGAPSRSVPRAPSTEFFKRHFAGSLRAQSQDTLIGATSTEASYRTAAALASADQALSAVRTLCGLRPATQPLPGGRACTALSQEDRRLMEQAVSGRLKKLRQMSRESRSSPHLEPALSAGNPRLPQPGKKLKLKPSSPPSSSTIQPPVSCWSSQPASAFPLRSPHSQAPCWPAGEQQHLLGPAVNRSWDAANPSRAQGARLLNSAGADKRPEPSVRHSMPAGLGRACSAGYSDRPREAAAAAAGAGGLPPRAALRRASHAAAFPATLSAGHTSTLNPGPRPSRGLIYSVFQDLDRFGEGRITYSTLEEAAVQVGMKKDQVSRLYARLDPHTRGYITVRDWGQPQLEGQLADFTRLFVKKTRGANGRHKGANEVKSLYAAIQMALFKLKLKNSGRSVGHDRLVQAFQFIDRDANGSLDRYEVLDAFGGMGIYIDDAVLDEVMRTFDKDNDGTVNYSEFIGILFPTLNNAIAA